MAQATQKTTPLRQRMIEDMHMRQLSAGTQRDYIRAVFEFTRFFGQSPDKATAEDLRRYLLHRQDNGMTPATQNAIASGLKFFFNVTLERHEVVRNLRHAPQPRKLPMILSREEVTRLFEATDSLKYKAAFAVAYGAGLRVSEVVNLKVSDIDSDRMVLRVEQGKGRKDRYAKLSPVLLETLRNWWREGKAKGKVRDNGWLFPGMNPVNHLSGRQLARVCKLVAEEAGLDKKVTMHSLRHAYATHLLEDKVDIRVIQVLLGHSKIESTTRYTQVASKLLQEVTSPLDTLNPTTQ